MCGIFTNSVVNINLEAVHICNPCCKATTKQTVMEMCNTPNAEKPSEVEDGTN